MSKYWIIVCAVAVLALLFYAKGCERPAPRTITIHDTTFIERVRIDSLVATRWSTVYRDRHDTTLVPLVRVESLLVHDSVKSLTVCADTIARGDTVNVCYEYVGRRFAIGIAFAPRVKDTTVTLRPSLFAWHPYVGGEIGIDKRIAIYGGAGARVGAVGVYGVIEIDGTAVNAKAGVQIEF